jgi:hypothetical protein
LKSHLLTLRSTYDKVLRRNWCDGFRGVALPVSRRFPRCWEWSFSLMEWLLSFDSSPRRKKPKAHTEFRYSRVVIAAGGRTEVNVYAARQRYRKKWDVNCVFEKSLGYTIDGSRSKTAARPSSPLPATSAPLSSSSPPKKVSTGVFSAFATSLGGGTYWLRQMRGISRHHPEAPSRVRRRDLD